MEEDSMTNISGVSEDSQGDKDYVQPPSVQEKIWHSIAYWWIFIFFTHY